MGKVKLASAEPPGAQIPAASPPPRQQAKRPPSRRGTRRIQSRGSNRRPSSASVHNNKKKNAPCFGGARRALGAAVGDDNPALSSIQSLGGKRRFYFCANSPAWGAKRARSAISCGGGHVTPVDPAPAAQDVDWANLGDGPAGLIAELVLANDVADYIRFRAVCQPWRRCSPDPRAAGLDGRFLPRRWIMLVTAGPRCHRFHNISTGESIRMDLPELVEHRFLSLTPEGLILLLHESTLVALLLNPFTRQLIHLPTITRLLTREQRRARRLGHPFAVGLGVAGVGIVADASMVVVRFNSPTVLAVAKPGSESWTVVKDRHVISTTMFAGRFYCVKYNCVMMLDTSGADQPPRLVVAVKWGRSVINFRPMTHSLRLVDNGGELLLVHRMVPSNMDPGNSYKCEVYRVDLNAGILIPVKSLNGRAVFMGKCRAISISADVFPSVTLDTLYLGNDCGEKSWMDGYNIADGSNEPRHDEVGAPLYSRGLPLFQHSGQRQPT